MSSSKIVLPSLSTPDLHNSSSTGKVKLPGVQQLMNDTTATPSHQYHQPQPQHYYNIQQPCTPVGVPLNSRSVSLPSNVHIPTLSSLGTAVASSGLYSPVSTVTTSPVSSVRAISQPQILYYQDSRSYAKPQPTSPPYLPPSPVYQMPSPPSHYPFQQKQQQQQPMEQTPAVFYQLRSSISPSLSNIESLKMMPKQASAWSSDDDKLLRHLKEERKLGWRDVATYFPRRTPNACQFRWRRIVSASKSSILKKNQYMTSRYESKKGSVNYLLNSVK